MDHKPGITKAAEYGISGAGGPAVAIVVNARDLRAI
jgi:hypothetical protein